MSSRSQHNRHSAPFRFERLESRLLLSADPIVAGLSLLAPDAYEDPQAKHELPPFELKNAHSEKVQPNVEIDDLVHLFNQPEEQTRTILFVDTQIDDYTTLLDGIDGRVEIVVLDADSDGIEQVSAFLDGGNNIGAIHIASHGTSEGFWLGSTFVTGETLDVRAAEFGHWSTALSNDADILLYGCNLAATEPGQSIVETLAQLTGADVAASTDLTGNTSLGGDWELEFASGEVSSEIVFNRAAQNNWVGTLDSITVTTFADQFDGDADTSSLASLLAAPGADGLISLREAIVAANDGAGADVIFLGSGTYNITRVGLTDSASDFDIRDDLSIVGISPTASIINPGGGVRAFDIHDDDAITVSLSNLKIENGGTNAFGGRDGAGIYLHAMSNTTSLYLSNVWFLNNNTSGSSDEGGAIYNEGKIYISNSLFELNSSDDGGAIYNTTGATLEVSNTSFHDNRATSGNGGAINNQGTATLTNVTISAGSASSNGGGIHTDAAGSTTLTNSIVSGNTSPTGPDINGAVLSGGTNIIGDDSDASGFVGSDQRNVDPLLGLLADNGGDLKSQSLGGASTAINNAGSSAPDTDQRGFLRDANPDIGAFETGAASQPETATLWFSTDDAVSSGGQQGMSTWDQADILSFDNPNLHLGPATTSGTVGLEIDFPAGPEPFEGLHFVSKTVNIAGGAFQLLRGDVLFNSKNNAAVFTSNNAVALQPGFSATVNADRRDVVVFRPDVVGNYTAGQFGFLVDDISGGNIHAFTLVEDNIDVGGTSLSAGDFLYVQSGGAHDNAISIFTPTAIGDGTTTGSDTLFLDGDDADIAISDQIHGLELIENTITIGGQILQPGQLLVSLDNNDTVGSNGLSVAGNDIFVLNISQSTENAGAGNGAATASVFFTGGHTGFDSNEERFNSLALSINETLPIADESAGAPHTITAGGTVSFDGSNSSDPDGTITNYTWDINNDGSFEKTGVTVSYDWSELNAAGVTADGTYDVALRVTDNDGNPATTVFTLTVNNATPTFTGFGGVVDSTIEDTQLEITFAELAAQGDEADIGGNVDAFIVQAVSSGTLLIGTDAGSATAFASGSNDVIGAGLNAYWTPAANQNGTLNAFTVRARDDDGAVSGTAVAAQIAVSDVNDTPTFSSFFSQLGTTNEDTEIEITFGNLATQGDEADVDGTVDSFVVQAVSTGTLRIGADAGSATAFAAGTNDTITVGVNAYWTPTNNQNGTLNAFTVVAKDNDDGLSGTPITAQINVTDVNDTPTFTTFAAIVDNTNEDSQVEITFAELTAQGNEADIDGTVDSFIVRAVSSGTLLIGADAGSATAFAAGTNDVIGAGLNAYWTPANNQNGTLNAFTVEARDNDGGLSGTPITAQMNVVDVNDNPSLTTFTTTIDNTNEDSQVEITFAELAAQGNEADIDGTVDSFIVRAVSSGTLLIGADAGSATAFAAGTNDVIGAGLNAYWTPANNQNGTLNAFTVEARDNDGGFSGTPITAQMTVVDVNDNPTLTTFTTTIDNTNEDSQVEITFAELAAQGNEADIDGTVDSFIVRAVSSGTLLIGADAGSATAFAAGTNEVIGAGLNAYWTPAINQNGALNAFTLEARDNNGGLSGTPITAHINVVDINDAPTFSTLSAAVATANTNVEEAISFANIQGVSNAADVDGSVNSYVVKNVLDGTLRIGTSAATATAWVAGANDVIDATNNAYWTSSALATGTVNAFGVVARDDDGGESATTIQAQVTTFSVNQAPTLEQNALSVAEGESKTLSQADLLANDLDDPASQLQLNISGVANGQFERASTPGQAITSFTQAEINSGAIKFVHDGGENPPSYSVTVSDGNASTAIAPVTVLFSNVNDSPALNLNQLSIEQDGSVTLTVGGNLDASDPDNEQNNLIYQASNIVGGQFERISNPGTEIQNFSQQELQDGRIQFIHDGSAVAPSYQLTVSDGTTSSAPATVKVSFTPIESNEFFTNEQAAAESFASSEILSQGRQLATDPSTKQDEGEAAANETDEASLTEQALALQEINEAIQQSRSAQSTTTSNFETYDNESASEDSRTNRSYGDSIKTLLKSQLNLGTSTTDALLNPIDAALDLMVSVVESSNFKNGLDSLRKEMANESLMDQVQIGSSVAVSTGLSIGYVVWLIRGGVLVSSMLSALPAWRFIDPLPILAFGGTDEDEDQESLESLVETYDQRAPLENDTAESSTEQGNR